MLSESIKSFVINGYYILHIKISVPTFVVDAPSGGGKIPVGPNYLISQSSQKTILRNFEGVITSYPEPDNYQEHDVTTCSFCQAAKPSEGVAGLMGNARPNLEPKKLIREQRRITQP
ncbi:hypothetical protein [Shimazuella kribbensis]|uniref:hypothetical protein n=1 Tax=Shimazuella kribbensis TaxID=139808 RepID=UPI00048C5985|nr:hypothetical protein [Shimazuella kribbensis]